MWSSNPTAWAADVSARWETQGDGDWTTSVNWDTNPDVPNGPLATATFPYNLIVPVRVDVDAAVVVQQVRFESDRTVDLLPTGMDSSLTLVSSAELFAHETTHTIWVDVLSSDGLVKSGEGTVTMRGAVQATGDLSVLQGKLQLYSGSQLSGFDRVILPAGGTLDVDNAGPFASANHTIELNGGHLQGRYHPIELNDVVINAQQGGTTKLFDLKLAQSAGSTAALNVMDTGTIVRTRRLELGLEGVATATVENGGQVFCESVDVSGYEVPVFAPSSGVEMDTPQTTTGRSELIITGAGSMLLSEEGLGTAFMGVSEIRVLDGGKLATVGGSVGHSTGHTYQATATVAGQGSQLVGGLNIHDRLVVGAGSTYNTLEGRLTLHPGGVVDLMPGGTMLIDRLDHEDGAINLMGGVLRAVEVLDGLTVPDGVTFVGVERVTGSLVAQAGAVVQVGDADIWGAGPQLVNHFPFDYSTNDLANNQLSLRRRNAATMDVVHKVAGAGSLHFADAQANDQGEVSSHNYGGPGGDDARTISLWFKGYLAANTDGAPTLFSFGENDNSERFDLRFDKTIGHKLRLEIGGSFARWETGTTLDGLWHHVALVMDDGDTTRDIDLYLDGVLQVMDPDSSLPGGLPNTPVGREMTFGNSLLGYSGRNFVGYIDDAQIYDTALTATEVGQLFANPGVALTGGEMTYRADTLNVTNLTLQLGSVLRIDLATTESHDRLLVTNTASLGGGLEIDQELAVLPGDGFVVLESATIVGTFDHAAVTGAEIDADHALAVLYEDGADADTLPDRVRLFATLKGDANADGAVTLADLDAVGTHFGTLGATWQQGDFNYDGQVTLADLDAVGLRFGQSIAATPASVPEPGALPLLALGALMVAKRKRSPAGRG